MADFKYFLDFEGLSEYDKLIKEYIKTGSTDEIEKIIADLAEIAEKDEQQDTQIKSINEILEVLNGDDTVEGSIDSKVKTAVDNLVDGAPEALDTLKEIAEWIGEDETGTAALIKRVSDNEEAIAELQAEDEVMKEYVDTQDLAYYNAIQAIENLKIASLFPVKQAEGQSAAVAIATVEEGKAIQLLADQTITEDIVIDKSCYIDANGATFEGTITVPADADVVIENATFSKPVVVA